MFGRDHHGVSSPVLLLGIITLPFLGGFKTGQAHYPSCGRSGCGKSLDI